MWLYHAGCARCCCGLCWWSSWCCPTTSGSATASLRFCLKGDGSWIARFSGSRFIFIFVLILSRSFCYWCWSTPWFTSYRLIFLSSLFARVGPLSLFLGSLVCPLWRNFSFAFYFPFQSIASLHEIAYFPLKSWCYCCSTHFRLVTTETSSFVSPIFGVKT